MITFSLALKLSGGAMMILSLIVFALVSRKSDTERLTRLEHQISFVSFIREKIDRYLLPVGEIIRECNKDVLCGICIGCGGVCEFADVEGLRAVLRSSRYFSDGGEILEDFMSHLGGSYRDEEIAACDACISKLSDLKNRLETELPKERKSRAVLAFCLMAALVIILL